MEKPCLKRRLTFTLCLVAWQLCSVTWQLCSIQFAFLPSSDLIIMLDSNIQSKAHPGMYVFLRRLLCVQIDTAPHLCSLIDSTPRTILRSRAPSSRSSSARAPQVIRSTRSANRVGAPMLPTLLTEELELRRLEGGSGEPEGHVLGDWARPPPSCGRL